MVKKPIKFLHSQQTIVNLKIVPNNIMDSNFNDTNKGLFQHNGKFTWGVLKVNIIRNIFHEIFHINT